jgi:hypothetical protein
MEKQGIKRRSSICHPYRYYYQSLGRKNIKEYKILKGLKKENLRDNMSNTELILNMLAEASTKDISAAVKPAGFEASKKSG